MTDGLGVQLPWEGKKEAGERPGEFSMSMNGDDGLEFLSCFLCFCFIVRVCNQ